MATQTDKLAQSRKTLSDLFKKTNRTIFRSAEFSRVHRERLIQSGFLLEILKGWLLMADPLKKPERVLYGTQTSGIF